MTNLWEERNWGINMDSQFGRFDCWIFWKSDKHCRIPLDLPAIYWYREHGVAVDIVGEYK